jgi:hypothetical protein
MVFVLILAVMVSDGGGRDGDCTDYSGGTDGGDSDGTDGGGRDSGCSDIDGNGSDASGCDSDNGNRILCIMVTVYWI